MQYINVIKILYKNIHNIIYIFVVDDVEVVEQDSVVIIIMTDNN